MTFPISGAESIRYTHMNKWIFSVTTYHAQNLIQGRSWYLCIYISFCIVCFVFLNFTYKWDYMVFVFLSLTYFVFLSLTYFNYFNSLGPSKLSQW